MQKLSFLIVIVLTVLAVAAGAFYQVSFSPQEQLDEYINSFVSGISNGVHHKNIFINALKDGLFTVSVIFICGFVRFGFVISVFSAVRRSFIAGFTSAAFIRCFGMKGLLTAAAVELPFMLTLIPLTALCCSSVSMSFRKGNYSEVLRPYCILTVGTAAVFAAAALCEGYAVTWLIALIL